MIILAAMSVFFLGMEGEEAMSKRKWKDDAFFGLHYDLHPNAHDTELGRETTYEHIRAMLEKVKPEYVQYDCKGHAGYTGYPTKIGSPSPGIVNDALKIWRQVTRDMGIPLSIHYSGVWDTRAVELHPEWARIDAEGKPSPDHTDPLSGYTTEFMIPQLLEVIDAYDIDGVWIDGENWASHPSWSPQCMEEFRRRTGIQEIPRNAGDPHWEEWLAFHRDLFTEHVRKYTEALHARKSSLVVCSNWMYSYMQPEPVNAPVDYLSGDFDPSFGAERARTAARFFASRNKPWDLMAWAFLRTGDQQWTMKTVPHLCQEVAVVLSQGGGVFIYNQPQRSGRLTEWHQDILAGVAEFCREGKEWCFQTETVPQIAVLYSHNYYYRNNHPLFNAGSAGQPMDGAIQALLENGYSIDVMNEEALMERMADYPVVVIPEQDGLPDDFIAAAVRYVNQGGKVLLSGGRVPQEWPAEFTGAEAGEIRAGQTYYIPAEGGCVPISGLWCATKPRTAKELGRLLYQQEPDLNQTEFSSATLHTLGKGAVLVIPGPIFQSYFQAHYPRIREFVGTCLQALDVGDRLIRREGPAWIDVAARKKGGRLLIQLTNLASSNPLSPNRHMVEDVPVTPPFRLRIPLEASPKACYTAPEKISVRYAWRDGVLWVDLENLYIHNVLVIEL